jgi:hypothetical protein
MNAAVATKVLSRFLLPRVKARVDYMRSGCRRGCIVHVDYLKTCSSCYDPVFGGGRCEDCRYFAAADAARQKIARFLEPRVRAWATARRGGVCTINTKYLYPCSVCWGPSFGGNWCAGCREHSKRDPVSFAKSNFLCRHCFMPEGPEGCTDMCEESREEMRQLNEEMDWYDGADRQVQQERNNRW